MLVVSNLSIKTIENDRELISNLSFSAQSNDKIAIIGEEGNGKSTLIKALYNINFITDYCNITGTINTTYKKIGYLSQFLLETNKTIEEYILSNEYNEIDYDFYQTIYSNQSLFSKFNLDINILTENRLMGTLSGGERIKIGLIKILLQEPDLILLDEPTNDLDISSLLFLEDFIINTSKPIIFISHDETLLEKTANKIIHLEQRERKTKAVSNVANISYTDYIEQRLCMIEKETRIAKMQQKEYKTQKEILNNQYNKVHHELETITRSDPAGARLLKKKMKSIKSHEKRFEREKESFTEIPNVEESLNAFFDENINIPTKKEILNLNLKELKINDKVLVKNINLNVTGPKHIVIIGENGIGKSILIKEIYDDLKVRADIKVEYMPQTYSELLDDEMIAYEYVAKSLSKEDVSKARTIMGSMKFTSSEMTTKIKNLSGGQKAKLFLIKIILKNPNVLILDEPTRNLSPLSNPVIRDMLSDYTGAIISVSHDRKFIKEVCDEIYVLNKNGLEFQNYDQIYNLWDNDKANGMLKKHF